MSDEISFAFNLTMRKQASDGTLLVNQPYSGSFRDDMAGNAGPAPGVLTVPLGGVQAAFTYLTEPGWCVLTNLGLSSGADPAGDEYVEIGIYDPGIGVFYPLLELGPGEKYPVKLSRNLREEFAGTGTNTTSQGNQLFLKAVKASQKVAVEAWER